VVRGVCIEKVRIQFRRHGITVTANCFGVTLIDGQPRIPGGVTYLLISGDEKERGRVRRDGLVDRSCAPKGRVGGVGVRKEALVEDDWILRHGAPKLVTVR
jgi:hypothetical protein